MLKHAFYFLTGFGAGFIGVWGMDENFYHNIAEKLNLKSNLIADHLNVPSDIPIEQRRDMFKSILNEKGPSYNLIILVSDYKRELFDSKENLSEKIVREEEILENHFRKVYPQLFDSQSGIEFINSLKLRTESKDFKIPLLRRGK
jgi:hypothetical protein